MEVTLALVVAVAETHGRVAVDQEDDGVLLVAYLRQLLRVEAEGGSLLAAAIFIEVVFKEVTKVHF